jgi:hypothetical protein
MRNFSRTGGLPADVRKLTLAGVTIAVGAMTLAPANAQQAPPRFSAYPMPGTLTAHPETTISFRGGDQAALGTVTVKGSRSGNHPGTFKAHSDGEGTSFVPDEPFEENERVTVTTDREVVNADGGDFSFEIGDETTRSLRPVELPNVGRGTVQTFRTRPDLEPPSVTVTTAKPGRAPGLVFLAPKAGRGQDGPMIIDDKGDMVWFKPMQGKLAADFRAQTYDGKPVITWWEGRLYVGDGDGVGKIYDNTYKPVANVRTGNGYSYDLHEFTITPRNTALVMAYERFERSLKAWKGPSDAKVVDNIIQEVDIKTGQVIFEWHSFGNVSPDESLIGVPKNRGSEWEYFHANAIDLDRDGNFLISARNTSTIYKVNRVTGKIMWRLGGKKSDFKLGPGVRFDWQHSIRVLPNGDLRIYDNSAAPPVRKASRAITVRLDEQAGRATLVSAFRHPRKLLSANQGNVETLPNGNLFVGWGSQRWFTELSPTGEVLFDGHIARGNDNYRAFRYPWSAKPYAPPRLSATASDGKVTAYVSWNGATDVTRWELLGGASEGALAPIGSATKDGFETALRADAHPFVAVRAYDAAGNVLTTSAPIRPRGN